MSRKGKHDVAPVVRSAFLTALERIKNEQGITFSQIIAKWMIEDPGAVLNAVSKFTVREAKLEGKVEHEHKHVGVSQINDWLAEFTKGSEDSDDKTTGPH